MMENNVKVFPLGKDTWQLQEGQGGSAAHLYLLAGKEKAVLIDTGYLASDILEIVHSLTDYPVFVVNTHGHLDHISANHQFDEAYLHPGDEELFAEHIRYEVRRGFAEGLMIEQGQPVSLLDSPQMRDATQRMCNLPRRENRLAMGEGMVFDLGGRHVQVIETPGHTMGSVCLLDQEHRWLFTGDTVCDQGVLLHFPHSAPVGVFAHSIKKLQAMASRFDEIWPGHHRCPLEKELLQKYIDCAGRIAKGELGEKTTSAAGAAQVLLHEGIALSFPIDG